MYCIVLCHAWYWGILGCQSFCDTGQKRHKFTPSGGPPGPHHLSLYPYPKRVIVDRCCQQYKLNYTIKKEVINTLSDQANQLHQNSICWNCVHALPCKNQACTWSKSFIPVPGSTQIPGGKLPTPYGRVMVVTSCPEFEKWHDFTTPKEVVLHIAEHFQISCGRCRSMVAYYTHKYLLAAQKDPSLTPLPGWFTMSVETLSEREKERLETGKRGKRLTL